MSMNIASSIAAFALALTAPAIAQSAEPIPPRYQPRPYVGLTNPAWSRDAVIYQINTRQFTPQGTFRAAMAELPRLKALGVDILWLMPIHPIGAENRKGTLGSPYAVRDYFDVNPEFGTKADFKAFVDAAHAQGMHVILDWVANHSAWDNPLRTSHPEYYVRTWNGNFRPTLWLDWSDIIDFDYEQAGLRQYMTAALTYWVREFGVDGYRADVAGMVPTDFWDNARAELDAIKPVFMLAEWQYPELHRRAFDASYAWDWHNAMHAIGTGKADVGALFGYYSSDDAAWPHGAMRMLFTSNHDKNSWEGTEYELFGPALANVTALTFIADGIPLIYNGQEAGNARRLQFFEKDPIVWPSTEHPNAAEYRRLIAFRDANPALHNGRWGAEMVPVVNTAHPRVFTFVREKDGNKIFGIFNFSAEPQEVGFTDGPFAGTYSDYRDGSAVTVEQSTRLTIPAWSHRVLVNR
jgi:glycosidase